MDASHYPSVWSNLRADMELFLQNVATHVFEKMGCGTLAPAQQGGDEEFKLSLDWQIDNSPKTIVGMDLVLADAEVRGEEDAGFGILIDMQGYGGEPLGTYAPFNYTPEAFTQSEDELRDRLRDLQTQARVFGEFICNALTERARADRPAMR